MKLTITLEVDDKLEAYQTVTDLGMEHTLTGAILVDGKTTIEETFDENNKPYHFLKDKENISPEAPGRCKEDLIAENEARLETNQL